MAMHRKLGSLVIALAGLGLGASSPALASDAADQGAADQRAADQRAADQGAADQGAADQGAAGETDEGTAVERGAAEMGEAEMGEAEMGEAEATLATEMTLAEMAHAEMTQAEMAQAKLLRAELAQAQLRAEVAEAELAKAREGTAAETESETYGGVVSIQLPQHLIADTSLYIANASNTARILHAEQALHVQSAEILSTQASFLVMAIDHSLASIEDLNQNALATHPQALPAIHLAIAQLAAARAQAQEALDLTLAGQLGPSFSVAIRAAHNHLRSAALHLRTAAYRYGHGALVLPVGNVLYGAGSSAAQYGTKSSTMQQGAK